MSQARIGSAPDGKYWARLVGTAADLYFEAAGPNDGYDEGNSRTASEWMGSRVEIEYIVSPPRLKKQ